MFKVFSVIRKVFILKLSKCFLVYNKLSTSPEPCQNLTILNLHTAETYSVHCKTFKMEFLVKINTSFQILAVYAKSSILDV